MKMEVTKTIEYTFYIEVDPDDYKDYQEDGDYGYLDHYIADKDPAYAFDHGVIAISVFAPEDI